MNEIIPFAAFAGTCLAWIYYQRKRRVNRIQAIRVFGFPDAIPRKVKEAYPHLSDEQVGMVMKGLRQFFIVSAMARGRMVSMPSQAVDVAWHEFILFTRAYERFCRKVLGRFLHHTPAEAMSRPTLAQEGIKRAWRLACLHEKINPRRPVQLPLLFAIDQLLEIPGGYRYALDCLKGSAGGDSGTAGDSYCAAHIDCTGGCSGSSGCAGGETGSNSDDGDGGGGDGGCGGGGD